METADINNQIEAAKVAVGDSVVIGHNSFIQAEKVTLGRGVRIGNNVEIICDRLELRDGCTIGANNLIICPDIFCDSRCSLGNSLKIELNEFFHLGKYCHVGHRSTITGQGFKSGEFLWLKDEIIVGGGGATGPKSYLTIGNRTSVFDKCFINLSEEITIGAYSALSYNVVLLTHSAWQPSLMGYPTKFAPIHIGNYVVVYLNSVVLPGVTIGDYSTVGASSLVLNDIPDHCLVAGNPATIRKGSHSYPRTPDGNQIDLFIRAILADYLTTLKSKGVNIIQDDLSTKDSVIIEYQNQLEKICYIPISTHHQLDNKADITLSYDTTSQGFHSRCHFDLANETVIGKLSRVADDLRDYLRRRGIRIFIDGPFQSLPLANLHRLEMIRKRKKQ